MKHICQVIHSFYCICERLSSKFSFKILAKNYNKINKNYLLKTLTQKQHISTINKIN